MSRKQLEIPGSHFQHFKQARVIDAQLKKENDQVVMALIFEKDHDLVMITLSEEEASRLMGQLEKHFCSDPNCERHQL